MQIPSLYCYPILVLFRLSAHAHYLIVYRGTAVVQIQMLFIHKVALQFISVEAALQGSNAFVFYCFGDSQDKHLLK